MQNQTISELYTDDNKSKCSNNSKGIFKSAKKFNETLFCLFIHSQTNTKSAGKDCLTAEFF